MSRDLTNSELEYIVARVLENASYAKRESAENPNDDFFHGRTRNTSTK